VKQQITMRDANNIQSVEAYLFDHQDKQLVIFTTDMLVNQLRRESPRIEASFDRLCDEDLHELSAFLSKSVSLLYSGLRDAQRYDMKLKAACAQLLMNVSNSFTASVALLRMGYVLQPGIIIRSMLEGVSTVLHLLQRPSDLTAYESGTLKSPKTINAAKKALPQFGILYSYFSDNFAHIGHLHKSLAPISEFTERHKALEVNLNFLRIATWLLYVTTELLFNELVERPRYWHPASNGYSFDPSVEEREWMVSYFRMQIAT
jgi:coenzyme F420-reducing hydrogenase delta subunit